LLFGVDEALPCGPANARHPGGDDNAQGDAADAAIQKRRAQDFTATSSTSNACARFKGPLHAEDVAAGDVDAFAAAGVAVGADLDDVGADAEAVGDTAGDGDAVDDDDGDGGVSGDHDGAADAEGALQGHDDAVSARDQALGAFCACGVGEDDLVGGEQGDGVVAGEGRHALPTLELPFGAAHARAGGGVKDGAGLAGCQDGDAVAREAPTHSVFFGTRRQNQGWAREGHLRHQEPKNQGESRHANLSPVVDNDPADCTRKGNQSQDQVTSALALGGALNEPLVVTLSDVSAADLPKAFGDYTLLKPLGRGGMGQVFLANLKGRGLAGVDKVCVVKTLRATEDPEYERRFIDEARLIVLLSHKNICPVFDAGCFDGIYYLALEHIAGREVRHLQVACEQRGDGVGTSTSIHIIKETLEALDAAHRMVHPLTKVALRVVHRDVSPQNVMISEEGEVKLIDFGLAVSSQKMERTAPQIVMGKMAYMAPEQARGDTVDARVDQFAAGVMLYELLSNQRYYGDMAVDAIWRMSGRGGHVPQGLSALDPELQAVVMKATAPNRDDRYASCGDMRDALTAIELKRGILAGSRDLRAALQELDGVVSSSSISMPSPLRPAPPREKTPAPRERTRTFRLVPPTDTAEGGIVDVGIVEGLEPGAIVTGAIVTGDNFRTVTPVTTAIPSSDEASVRAASSTPKPRPEATVVVRTATIRPNPPAATGSDRRLIAAAVAVAVVLVAVAAIAVAVGSDEDVVAVPAVPAVPLAPIAVAAVVVDAGAADAVDAGAADAADAVVADVAVVADAGVAAVADVVEAPPPPAPPAPAPTTKRPRDRKPQPRRLPPWPANEKIFVRTKFLSDHCSDVPCSKAFYGENLKKASSNLDALEKGVFACYRECRSKPSP